MIIDPQGRMPRRYEYDTDNGRLIAVIDENGNRRESLFDPQGFIGLQTDARGNITEIQYDERGNVTRLEDPKGNVTLYEYGDPANPDRETLLTDPSGEEWNYTYDAMGRPTDLTSPLAVASNQRISVSYDEFGNITEYNDYDRRISQFTFDPGGNRLSEAVRWAPQRLHLERGRAPDPACSRRHSDLTEYDYDANGYLSRTSESSGAEESSSAWPTDGSSLSPTPTPRSTSAIHLPAC